LDILTFAFGGVVAQRHPRIVVSSGNEVVHVRTVNSDTRSVTETAGT